MNKELQVQLFSWVLDFYSLDRGIEIYKKITNLLQEEAKVNEMTPTEKAIHEANSNSEDSPQCRLDKYILGECNADFKSVEPYFPKNLKTDIVKNFYLSRPERYKLE